MKKKVIGVFMMNLGGPNNTSEIGGFLQRFFSDDSIIRIPFKLGQYIGKIRGPYKVTKQYEEIGGKSPILEITKSQGEKMCKILNEKQNQFEYQYYPAFRYGLPLYTDSIKQFLQQNQGNIQSMVLFPQFPQYSCSTTGNALRFALDFVKNINLNNIDNKQIIDNNVNIQIIDKWYYHPDYIKFIAQQIEESLLKFKQEDRKDVIILFSAHSNPINFIQEGDVYIYQIGATMEMIMNLLNRSNPYRLSWQSKVGFQEWLKPTTPKSLKQLSDKGWKNIIICPIGFTTENLETLYEIDIEYIKHMAQKLFTQVERIACPDDHPQFIQVLADVVLQNQNHNLYQSPNLKVRCIDCKFDICNNQAQYQQLAQQKSNQKQL